ncbi:MAG: hypothetical protein DRJ42_01985 [Deltaproteobacteria bacterium]|nr:MAG: hypothetical protein DRJ42_01985 [Deltaproteobacteria bacterium]
MARFGSALLTALVLLVAGASTAQAQSMAAGALSAQALVASTNTVDADGTDSTDAGYGGMFLADVTMPLGLFRVGGAMGLGAITSSVDAVSRVFMPLTVSLGLVYRPSKLWLDLRARAGLWAGVTNQGLSAGPLVSFGAFIGYAFGPTVAVGPTIDALFVFGHGDTIAVAPGLSLVWVPPDIDD